MTATALFALALSVIPLTAGLPPEHEDAIARHLFPPAKVLAHQREIGLDEAQRRTIRDEVVKAQSKFSGLQIDLQGESEKMAALLEERPISEAKVLEEADKIMGLEREIKKTHLALLIRIKNLLSREQQAKLAEINRAEGK